MGEEQLSYHSFLVLIYFSFF